MTAAPVWLNVKDAATLVHRDISRIYAWIREERLTSEEDEDGVTIVTAAEVLELDARLNRRRNNKKRRVSLTPNTNRTTIRD